MPVTEKDVRSALRTVQDPELHLDLVVLGLVYDIEVDGGDVHVVMSLTSPMCPVADQIVLDLVQRIDHLGLCVAYTQLAIEAMLGGDEYSLVDGRAQYTATVLEVIAGEVGAAPK